MSAEPEDIAAVEGDKPETCPTCGGPCTKEAQSAVEMAMMATPHYRSLVKGEVVADREVTAFIADSGGFGFYIWPAFPKPEGPGHDEVLRVLVIRAARKENAGTGGKERDANSS